MKRNRVVITGMGILAPNGIGNDEFWESLVAGRSGIAPITLFDASDLKSRIAGEVKNFDPYDYIEPELKPKRMARHTQFAYAAAMMALEDAGLEISESNLPSPTPVVVGVSTSALDVIENVFRVSDNRGINAIAPTALGASKPQAAANVIADRIGARAHAATISSACRSGAAELAIAGGADAPITRHGLDSFIASGLSTSHNGDGQHASRPFDLSRESGVLSEGAGMFVLENLERAEARGARTYIELSGYGARRDLDLDQPGSGLRDSMEIAVANAESGKEEIDYISAYGPGDPTLDAAEVRCIKEVFGNRAYLIPVSSIKGVTGNPLAAAGPLQIAACALSIRDQLIPPTANYQFADPDCDLDVVPLRARKAKIDRVLLNVRGLGGSASSLVLDRVPSR
jgi:3-oxoacyl-[acyl-carrier-protein] synthase II